ncbi:hypothetical protein OOZ15_10330 [Galbibacter sp. EGI 63066]|uniref:hypothetical protein n=1 Tax=Galbibacter sp. EGI 63066 TaxID=2993559 RepID=UPI0022492CFE|nr:hypothetical protein [Galbibacter sp. EGI 63066]MCX2680337.1 hypothetical protein [Galbibacter sp. EGI 63066]
MKNSVQTQNVKNNGNYFKMNLLLKTTALLAVVFILTSCRHNDDFDDLDSDGDFIATLPTAEAFTQIKEQALENQRQHFQFSAEDGTGSFTSNSGVEININASCLEKAGDAVTGDIDVEFVELFEKGNMLSTNKPTMGRLPSGDKAMLVSGGEFYINATQDGEQIDLICPLQLIVPADLTGGEDQDMTLWTGTIDEDDNLTWDEEEEDGVHDGAAGQGGDVFVEGPTYYAFVGEFGWTNVDRFYNDPRPKTTLKVSVPEGYNKTNSTVYLSYDGEPNALANLDTFLSDEGVFSEHYGQIPIGLEVHVIFATEDEGDWRYAIKSATIVENGVISIVYSDTAIATEQQLIDLINDLP